MIAQTQLKSRSNWQDFGKNSANYCRAKYGLVKILLNDMAIKGQNQHGVVFVVC